jgi:import inner membrane translocase subunit TIM50
MSTQTAMPILDKIDPLSYYFMYRLFRDSTRYYKSTLVKDLSYLGRDLSKVIILETNPAHVQTQPENAVILPAWKGAKDDNRLMAYIPFLEAIALNRVADVRPILSGYQDKDIPSEFAARQEAFKEKQLEEWRKRKAEADKSIFGSFSVGALFGLVRCFLCVTVRTDYLTGKQSNRRATHDDVGSREEALLGSLPKGRQGIQGE